MVTSHRALNAVPGRYRPLPDDLHPALSKRLVQAGLGQLYSHQADSYANVRQERNIVVVHAYFVWKDAVLQLAGAPIHNRESRHQGYLPFPNQGIGP